MVPFVRIFDRFLKNVLINEFEIEFGHYTFSTWYIAEDSNNKLRIVYDLICGPRVKQLHGHGSHLEQLYDVFVQGKITWVTFAGFKSC